VGISNEARRTVWGVTSDKQKDEAIKTLQWSWNAVTGVGFLQLLDILQEKIRVPKRKSSAFSIGRPKEEDK